jgi:hypothetical protein
VKLHIVIPALVLGLIAAEAADAGKSAATARTKEPDPTFAPVTDDPTLPRVQLIQVLASHGYMGAAKSVMAMFGVEAGPVRLPNGNPTAQQVKELRAKLEAMGFFEWIRR